MQAKIKQVLKSMEMKLTLATQVKQGDDERMQMALREVQRLEEKYQESF